MLIRAHSLVPGVPRGKKNPEGKILTANSDHGRMRKASVKVEVRNQSSPLTSADSVMIASSSMICASISKTTRERT